MYESDWSASPEDPVPTVFLSSLQQCLGRRSRSWGPLLKGHEPLSLRIAGSGLPHEAPSARRQAPIALVLSKSCRTFARDDGAMVSYEQV